MLHDKDLNIPEKCYFPLLPQSFGPIMYFNELVSNRITTAQQYIPRKAKVTLYHFLLTKNCFIRFSSHCCTQMNHLIMDPHTLQVCHHIGKVNESGPAFFILVFTAHGFSVCEIGH